MEWAINLLWNGLWKGHPDRHELMVQRELGKGVILFCPKESHSLNLFLEGDWM